MTTPRSMFEGGLGLPLAAIGWSIVISFAGCWAWLETAHFWAFLAGGFDTTLLSDGYVGYFIAAAFALLAQWTANFVILRLRAGSSRWLWASYAICALYAAVSLHHVHEAMAAPGWRAQVEARAEARAPDLAIIDTNDQFIREARNRTLGLSTETVSRRNESVSGPLAQAMEAATQSNADARARLAEIPALPDKRPLDWVDIVVAALACALALLEFTMYWGMGSNASLRAAGAKGTAEDTAAASLNASGDVVELRPVPAQRVIPETVQVGTLSFEKGLQGRALLDQLDKAGLIDKAACWSKVNAYPRPERRTAARHKEAA